MRIILITPMPPKSLAGNRVTAARWAHILRAFGHRVEVAVNYEAQDADLMIALHAWRSAGAIKAFRQAFPQRPLVLALTGTDAYRFIHSHTETTLESIRLADYLVGLHDLISNALPADQRHKMHVIYQSAQPVAARIPYQRYFHICVVGHLRDEKDSMRPALAARMLPDASNIQIHHYGKAHSEDWVGLAEAEMATNPRYHWHGEVAHHRIRQMYRRSQLLVLPSRMEGGANVISEAVVAGLPVIASDIEGSVGLLGTDYPGYYPVEDAGALSELMQRAESDPLFYHSLEQACLARSPLFTPRHESKAWQDLLGEIQHGLV